MGVIRAQTTTWIGLKKDDELVELAFNSRMMNVYNLSDLDEIVDEMIDNMKFQYAKCCSHYDDFRYRHKCLVD